VGGLFLVAACGSAPGGQNQAAGTPDTNASAPPAAATPVAATQTPKESAAATSPAGSATAITVEAVDSAFDVKTIEAPANSTFKVTLNNTGELPHDISFFDKEGGAPLAESAVSPIIQGGETATITFTTPGPGTYFFVCLVHPKEMSGSFVVK
jgi:plastocyanin